MSENELLNTIHRLNCDAKVHGILLQLPLDTDELMDCQVFTNAISVDKVWHMICVINISGCCKMKVFFFIIMRNTLHVYYLDVQRY